MVHPRCKTRRLTYLCERSQARLHGDRGDRHAAPIRCQHRFLTGIFWCVFSILPQAIAASEYYIRFSLDLSFVMAVRFVWKVAVIVAVSTFPLYAIKLVWGKISPAASSKLP